MVTSLHIFSLNYLRPRRNFEENSITQDNIFPIFHQKSIDQSSMYRYENSQKVPGNFRENSHPSWVTTTYSTWCQLAIPVLVAIIFGVTIRAIFANPSGVTFTDVINTCSSTAVLTGVWTIWRFCEFSLKIHGNLSILRRWIYVFEHIRSWCFD